MAHEFARIAGAGFHGIFACHLHVAAERQKADSIIGIAAPEACQALAKAQAEHFHTNLEQLGYGIMAELMDKNQNAQNKDKRDDIEREMLHMNVSFAIVALNCHRPLPGYMARQSLPRQ